MQIEHINFLPLSCFPIANCVPPHGYLILKDHSSKGLLKWFFEIIGTLHGPEYPARLRSGKG